MASPRVCRLCPREELRGLGAARERERESARIVSHLILLSAAVSRLGVRGWSPHGRAAPHTREAAQGRGAHRDDDLQVPPAVRVQQQQHSSPVAERELVPQREGRGLEGAEPGDGGLDG